MAGLKASEGTKTKKGEAWVVTLQMGLGHMRAAFPLRDIAHKGIVLYGTKETCDPKELSMWKRLLKIYYFLSNANKIPLVGGFIQGYLDRLLDIKPAYPKLDQSAPDSTVRMTYKYLKKGLCRSILSIVKTERIPVVSTYFATGLAIDIFDRKVPNYVVITDTDITRSWVPMDASKSDIIFCSPTAQTTRRLLTYGVKPSNIRETGFPLPKDNIGKENTAEILKADMLNRLARLDTRGKFKARMGHLVKHVVGKEIPKNSGKNGPITIMFAIGGAGAQFELVEEMLPSLKQKLLKGTFRFLLSCGTSTVTVERFKALLERLELSSQYGKGIDVVYDKNPLVYFGNFEKALRNTDILWTKPSELVFYAGLAIPVLCAPCIGPHEHLNQEWVSDLGAGIAMAGEAATCDQWITDMLDEGRFATAAWNGFMNVPRNGTFNIEKLVKTGKM